VPKEDLDFTHDVINRRCDVDAMGNSTKLTAGVNVLRPTSLFYIKINAIPPSTIVEIQNIKSMIEDLQRPVADGQQVDCAALRGPPDVKILLFTS